MQNIWKKRAFQVYSKVAWINDIIWIIHTNIWTSFVEEIYIDFQKIISHQSSRILSFYLKSVE